MCVSIYWEDQLATTARYWCLYCMYIRAARGSGFDRSAAFHVFISSKFDTSYSDIFFYCGANRSLQRLPSQRILRECTGNRRFYVIIYEQTDIYIYSVHIGTISKDTVGHCRDTYPGVIYIYIYIE